MDEIFSEKFTVKLSECYQNNIELNVCNTFEPCNHCGLFGAINTLSHMENADVIILGPDVCVYSAKVTNDWKNLCSGRKKSNIYLLRITSDRLIFGLTNIIREAILELFNDHHPRRLFLITTCLPEITGEDVNAIVEEIQERIKLKIIVIHTNNFSYPDHITGIQDVIINLPEMMQSKQKQIGTVNIMGFNYSKEKTDELSMILEKHGVIIENYFISSLNLENMINAPGVELNIVLDRMFLSMAKKMYDLFGTEFLFLEAPYAENSIKNFYKHISSKLNLDLTADISQIKNKNLSIWEASHDILANKSFIFSTYDSRIGRGYDLIKMLVTIGMIPLVIFSKKINKEDYPDIQELISLGINPLIITQDSFLDQAQYFNPINPDFIFGYVNDKIRNLIMKPDTYECDPNLFSNLFGFERMIQIIKKLTEYMQICTGKPDESLSDLCCHEISN